ncbi:MAG TPA: PilZ domain-containing protein [Thermoanaerobaculia bacterium]|nr:PilZ domain-containing protein [Thermoanaerobaculia bacterium]
MRPLTSSVSREELSELLNVPLDVVDALLDSGRVLCHVRGGEPRVPLAQLEEFFRDALLRLYQAESQGVPVEAPPARSPRPEREPDSEPMGEPVSEPEPEAEPEPRPAVEVSAPIFASPAPEPKPQPQHDEPEQRIATRFVPLRQLGGIFGDVKFVVMQLSATGLRIRHNEPLMPGDEAKLSFALMRPARSVVVRARVVWTSLAKSGTERFSISGLRITEHQDRVAAAIDGMRSTNELQPERRGSLRRATDTMSVISGISDEEMALVTAAVQKFAGDPVEASRWYSRARFALSDETVRRAAPQRPRDREEVLGIWEYLDRQVDIGKIAGVVSWMRSAGAAGGTGPRVT